MTDATEIDHSQRPGFPVKRLVGQRARADIVVIEMHPFWADCCMCGAETMDKCGVPYYYGPVSSSFPTDGGSAVCRPCYEQWQAWDATTTSPAYMPALSPPNAPLQARAASCPSPGSDS